MQENQIKREDIISDSEINDSQNKMTVEIMQKTAIDFADWISINYQKVPPLHLPVKHAWSERHKLRTIFTERFTTQELFEKFLEDYKG